jgi:long-chain acyl-CoA synthetase
VRQRHRPVTSAHGKALRGPVFPLEAAIVRLYTAPPPIPAQDAAMHHAQPMVLPAVPVPAAAESVSISAQLRGKCVLVTGATGFLGKVTASLLLHRHPDVGQVVLLIRGSKSESAEQRFWRQIARSGAFQPVADVYGAAYDEVLRTKVRVVQGDVTQAQLGLSDIDLRALRGQVDLVLHCAGLISFTPPLDEGIDLNAQGVVHMADFVASCDHAALLHVSTCYVTGTRDGTICESEDPTGFYPRRDDLQITFDAARELKDCHEAIARAHARSFEPERAAEFAHHARMKLQRDNRNLNDEAELHDAVRKERERWVRNTLRDEGAKRAEHWGWTNTYTYTKALGEQLLWSRRGDVKMAFVRPAIIETAVSYPVAGWNEGANTCAPLMYLMYQGLRFLPTNDRALLDVVPVDAVARSLLAVGAFLLADAADPIYQVGSSQRNPLTVNRAIELSSLSNRQYYQKRSDQPGGAGSMKRWKSLLLQAMDSVPVDRTTYERFGSSGIKRAAVAVQRWTNQLGKPHGIFGALVGQVRGATQQVVKAADTADTIMRLFMPFIHDNAFVFETESMTRLERRLPQQEKAWGLGVETLDWRRYWLDIHAPGMHKHVFPDLDAKLGDSNRKITSHWDLVDLFEASASNFADKVALQRVSGRHVEGVTYRELGERAEWVAGQLQARGFQPHGLVLLMAENRPEWAITYLGVLAARGSTVPVDPELAAADVADLAGRCRAFAVVVSRKVRTRLDQQGLPALLAALERPPLLVDLDAVVVRPEPVPALPSPDAGAIVPVDGKRRPRLSEHVAALVLTSGSGGQPKEVLLAHRNFTALVASVNQVLKVGEKDAFLSVLPLHHNLELTLGLLLPLSRGATVTYADAASGAQLREIMRDHGITTVVGVPQLWKKLHQAMVAEIDHRAPGGKAWFDARVAINRWLREKLKLNAGRVLFASVHRSLGGKVRYLISGDASLPQAVKAAFYDLGFDLLDGYGLTEAAPLITLRRPGEKARAHGVGKPLPGVEVAIENPDGHGVGEVVVKGPNVMLGYLDASATEQVLTPDGWLRTGDRGRIDKNGQLLVAGPQQDAIVTASGEIAYPDELEQAYGHHALIEELCIVGISDGEHQAPRIAALVRPVGDGGQRLSSAALQAIRRHFDVQGARMPWTHRVKVLRFTAEPLPRTAARKVKRREVDALLRQLDAHAPPATARDSGILALSDESAQGPFGGLPEAMRPQTSGRSDTGARPATLQTKDLSRGLGDRVDLPEPVRATIQRGLREAQRLVYDEGFQVKVLGRAHIPYAQQAIVCSNHCSHLDQGLLRQVLRDWEPELRTLAAADYFFDNKAKRTWFGQLTNLVPVERSGTLEESLAVALKILASGQPLLLFPEGTRSVSGEIHEFRQGLGYLALTAGVGVLPVWIGGTHRALPKGSVLPKRRKLQVRIGKVLAPEALAAHVRGMPEKQAWMEVSRIAREAVLALKEGRVLELDRLTGTQLQAEPTARANREAEELAGVFEALRERFQAHQVDGRIQYYFSLGDEAHQKWSLVVDKEACEIAAGKPKYADCVVKTSPDMLRRMILDSYVPGLDEFMSGVIKTSDPELLVKFQGVFGY